jgi:hypothetical protein
LLFVYLNSMPLLDSSIWLHIADGRWMLDHRALPQVDALQPLTEGMRIVHTTWLADVLFALAERLGGPNGVSDLFALAMLACLLLLARVFYIQTSRLSLMIAGLAMTIVFGEQYALHASPEAFGQLCFAALLWLVVWFQAHVDGLKPPSGQFQEALGAERRAWPLWAAIGLLFVLWANLHGSFLLGAAVLGCCAVARAAEVLWESRSLRAVLLDRPTRRWLLLVDLALVASFANPYGPPLIPEVISLARNEKVISMPQWAPLNISAPHGLLFLASLVLMAVVLRHSRRGMRPVEVLLLAVFGAATVPTARALGWYAVVYAFVLMPHVAEVCRRVLPPVARAGQERRRLTARSFSMSLICALVLYCGFRWAPVSRVLLGGSPRTMAQLVGSEDVYAVAEYIREHPSQGLVFAPIEWADLIVWYGGAKALMTSNVQWAPRRIWSDHSRMAQGQEGWYKGMDRYRVDTVVIDKKNNPYFAKIGKRSPQYRTLYENETAVVLRRISDARRREGVAQSGGAPAGETSPQS